jgi:hypothetical protein
VGSSVVVVVGRESLIDVPAVIEHAATSMLDRGAIQSNIASKSAFALGE